MTSAQTAAMVTWVYAAGFGLPTIPVGVYLLRRGSLPTFFGLFAMYGGPWFERVEHRTFVALLLGFLAVALVASWAAWLLWQGSRGGAVLALAVMPVEAVFWIGFALPIPWLIGVARVVLITVSWRSLT
jgi:hypothetical protein